MRIFFDKIIRPFIIRNKYTDICEIGASLGTTSDKLLKIPGVQISIIDPCFDLDLDNKYKNNERVRLYKGLSLEKLHELSQPYDCFLIDDDHNWYTVFNELRIIHERNLLKKDGAIFFHDVCWPYARRDMYHLPESIPEEFRHPYTKQGIKRGQSSLSEGSRFNDYMNNATHEGGPKNGVLTAIEDFLKTFGQEYSFFCFKIEYGLGIVIKNKDIKIKTMFPGLYYFIKYYEIADKLPTFIRYKYPFLYNRAAKIARILNIKRL